MDKILPKDAHERPPERPDSLQRLLGHDARSVPAAEDELNCEDLDVKELAVLLAGRLSAAERRLAVLARRTSQLASRLIAVESRWQGLAGQVGDHEESLRLVCEVLKELDDPYGFGLSLDERISDEGPGTASGDAN